MDTFHNNNHTIFHSEESHSKESHSEESRSKKSRSKESHSEESHSEDVIRVSPDGDIRIRRMLLEDYAGVNILMTILHEVHAANRPDLFKPALEPYDAGQFKELLKDPSCIAHVAEINGKLAGLCMASLNYPEENPITYQIPYAYITDLCVLPSFRKCGIGKMLFSHMEDIVKSMGITQVSLKVWAFNKSAVSFYEEMGFSPRSFIMEKEL